MTRLFRAFNLALRMDPRLKSLQKEKIYVGTSSWKYAGWKGLVYKNTYSSEKDFAERCLAEYATQYTAVGVDHTYYDWPRETAAAKYAAQTPPDFRFILKATEEVTVLQYPKLKRYGKRAGVKNESFLSAETFLEKFLAPLAPLKERLGPIVFEFSQFYPGSLRGSEFVTKLDRFLQTLRVEPGYEYAVEMRNANWLRPEYFATLAKHGVAHVFNSWTRMPSLDEQEKAAQGAALPFYVARLLLKPGTKYEEAVEAFSPYDRVQEQHDDVRAATARLIERARTTKIPAYVLVNNRLEGCSPLTIQGILSGLNL